MQPIPKHGPQEEEELPPDVLEFKRRMEEAGVRVRVPRPGAKWIEREPIDFGESVSDMVIRLRTRQDRSHG